MPNIQMITENIPELQSDTAIIWEIDINKLSSRCTHFFKLLNTDEQSRANRFHFKKDKDAFTITRSALRIILATYLCTNPESIHFSYNPQGKPSLTAHDSSQSIKFNISHSGNQALIAITANTEVGVDIELRKTNIDYMSLVTGFFSKNESEALAKCPPSERLIAFYNCWTRKEAYIKAIGLGLTMPLYSFTVSITTESPQILDTTHNDLVKWTLFNLQSPNDYTASLATASTIRNIQYINFAKNI